MEKNSISWSKKVRKRLIDLNMTITDLAKQLGVSRTYISAIINERIINDNLKEIINEFLEI